MKYQRKPDVFDVIEFDPRGQHKMTLPPCVVGTPSPGADNWSYEGCRFEAISTFVEESIFPGMMLLYRDGELVKVRSKHELESLYEPA